VTGSATVTTFSTNVDLTRLWHTRLAHMSENAMTILSKRCLLGSEGTGKLDFVTMCLWKTKESHCFDC